MIDKLGLLPLAQTGGSFWLPKSAVDDRAMDPVFYLILGICAFFFLLVVGLMVFFVIRYRRREGVGPEKTVTHNTLLEIGWSVIPLIIVGYIFYRGFAAYMVMQTPPQQCYEIRVTGKQWQWYFTYPNGHIDENLHVPQDEPIKLIMTSGDVIHGLWIPAFGVKMDLVPGRYSSVWLPAGKKVGSYRLLCTEYCGGDRKQGHSDMLAVVEVHSREDYNAWLKNAADFLKNLPPAEAGKILFQRRSCVQCHSFDEKRTAGTGPPLWGVFGETHDLDGGGTVVVDDNYIRESILEPQAKVRAGYQPVMSTYQGLVSDTDIVALIEYIKTLK